MRLVTASLGPVLLAISLAACGASVTPGANPGAQLAKPLKSSALLYVSASDGLYAYTYPAGKLRLKLTSYGAFGGLCVDATGDVFAISNGSGAEIYEFAHGSSSPETILREHSTSFDAAPSSCAIDPVTGDLAVANSPYTTAGRAVVGIFKNAQGSPAYYYDDTTFLFGFCAYDDQGNLYLDGEGNYFTGYDTYIAELPSGSTSFTNILADKWLGSSDLGGVQWDGKHLAVGDKGQTIHRFSIANGNATEIGTTRLAKAGYVRQFLVTGGLLLGGDDVSSSGSVKAWKYPGGGSPVATIVKRISNPVAVVISP